ncbi:MAG: hypothetical protein WCT27_01260 [Patescibacteria group bacterium]|jgi:hypothetical protein
MDPLQSIDALGNITKHELNISDIIMGAWKIFTDHLQAIVLITITVFLPLNIITVLLPGQDATAETLDPSSALGLGISAGLLALVGVLVPMAIAYIVRQHLDRQPVDFNSAIRFSFSRWLPVVGTSLLMMAFLFGLTFLLVLPAIIFAVYWAFTTYVVSLKGKSGLDALRYSQALVRGRWWKVIGYLFVFGFITGMIGWLIGLPFVNIHNHIVNALISTLSDIIFSFTIVATALFFINMDSVRRTPA